MEKKLENLDFYEIVENLYDGIYIADKEGGTLYVNNSYCKITGISRNEIIGRKVEDIEREGKLYKGSVTREVLKQRKMVSSIGKSLITGKDLLITGTPIFDENNDIKLVIVTDRDISNLKKLEDDIKMLKEINEKNDKQIFYLNEHQILSKSKDLSELPSNIFNVFKDISPTNLPILITGEYGSGKEMLAQNLYHHSPRKEFPFFSINAKVYSDAEFDRKLFGAEKSENNNFSLLELANNGTLYISDIDSLSQKLQKKLLKTLNSKKINNSNGELIDIDIRFIFSSNSDLKSKVENRAFLAELFNKISIISLNIPPLRERKEDIVKLSEKFLSSFNKKYSKNLVLSQEDLNLLELYNWPGNIKELEHLIERLVVSNDDDSDITNSIKSMLFFNNADILPQQNLTLKEAINEVERNIIIKALNQYGSINKAASILGISQPALSKKCKVLNILK